MPVKVPTADQLRAAAQKMGLALSDNDVNSFSSGSFGQNIAN